MKKLSFKTPSGPGIQNPGEELLRDVVLSKGEEYWDQGSGDAGLWFQEDDRRAELVLMLSSSHGLLVRYTTKKEDDEYYLSRKEPRNEWVTVWPGGEPWVVSARHFVPRQIAWTAVQEFCSTGGRLQEPEGFWWATGLQLETKGEEEEDSE